MRHPTTILRRLSIFLLVLLAALSLLPRAAEARGLTAARVLYYSSSGSVCGVVFSDRHGDGQCRDDDTPLCGVTVTLKNSSGATCGTATTDRNGKYTCSGLRPGNYTPCVPSSCGGQPLCDYGGWVCVSSGQCTTRNFCYQGPGSICGVVTTSCGDDSPCSNNDTPLRGVPVTIKDSSGATCGTDTTDSNGKYSCGGLKAGRYTVQVPATFNGQPVCSYSGSVSVTACQCATKNFCYQGPGSVGGLIFYDTNCSCVYNFCEPLLSGVTVSLVDSSGHVVATTTTNGYGLYLFSNIAPGNYTVQAPATFNGLVLGPCDLGVTVTSCQTACQFICYRCPPPPKGSITITKSANYGCVVGSGTSVTYTYVVKNTGSVTVSNIAVTDNVLGPITPTISSLAPGASCTLTKTATLTAASTNMATATGKDASGNTVAATSNSVTVRLIHPSISVSASATPAVVTTGSQTTISYVVTNTGDETLNDITVTDSQWGTVGTITSLIAGASQTLPLSVTPGVGATTSNVSVSGAAICSGTTVTASTTVTVTSSSPALKITASIPHGCIPATGGSIVYTYTVTNTGNVPLTGVTVTDSVLGLSDTLGTLANGASTTKTDTITLTAAQIAALAPGGTITTNTTATGTDSVTGLTVNAATAASLTVTVIHPTLGLTITPNPGTASPGDSVVFTYTVTNTGDIEIDNITVIDGNNTTLGNIGSLAVGGTQSFTETVMIPANATGSYSVSGTAAGVDACGHSPAQAQTTGTVVLVPHAQIVGTVTCSDCGCGIVGATVQLLDSTNAVVATTTTGAGGAYTFTGVADGSYTVQVTDAPDYSPNSGTVSNFSHTGSDYTVPVIPLTPTPIVYRSVQQLSGRAFFGTDPAFAALLAKDSNGNPLVLQQSDLYNSAHVSSSSIKTYLYNGTIPDFPEMGHFGGVGEPQIYVYYTQTLLPDTVWNGYSFTNQIGVYGVQGLPAEGTAGYYIYRFQFSMPFDGPGTARNYTLTGVESSYPTRVPTAISALSPSWIGGGAAPAAPPSGDLPAGWMARGIGEFQIPAYQTSTLYVDGNYTNACGDLFTFHIHPDMGGGIGSN